MKRNLILSLLLAISSLQLFSQKQIWTPLFNGKDLKGWTRLTGTADYKIMDGAIVGVSRMGTPNSFLATDKTYGDFILEFEFKVDDGLNSGVQFRSLSNKEFNNGRVHGYQFEIDPSARAWTGGIYDEARRGWLYSLENNTAAKTAFKNMQWNTARIEAIGNHLATWVNGIACANVLDEMTLNGFIALQVHAIGKQDEEGKTVSWRNIRICTKDVAKYSTPTTAPQISHLPNSITPEEAKDGWQLLWDGKTTNGWRGAKLDHFPEKGWAIENGILKILKGNGGESTNGGDIVTNRTYKNFILKVDFKITEGANSGIKYFVDPDLNKKEGSAIGCEFQILDDQNHPDAKLGVKGNRTLGSLYDLIPAPSNKFFNKTEFNTAMIVVKGNDVEHWLNGVKIISYTRNNQMWNALVAYSKYKDWPNFGNAESGNILLQDHGDEVWFRSIKIKELP